METQIVKKNNNLNFIKIKSASIFRSSDNEKASLRQPSVCTCGAEDLYNKCTKNSYNSVRQISPSLKMVKDLNKCFTKT